LIFLACISFTAKTGAQDNCNVESVPDSIYAAYAASLANHTAKSAFSVGGQKTNVEFRIPIHLYIAQDPSGRLPFDSTRNSIEAVFITALQYANESMASHNVEFYIVESDVVAFPTSLFYQSNPEDTDDYVRTQHPSKYDNNAFRVYLTEVTFAHGEYPYGVVIGGGNTYGRWLLHEIGHFFGLLHTFQHSYRNSNPWLFPDHSPTGFYDFNDTDYQMYSGEFCSDPSAPGTCFSDYIATTPVDFRDKLCSDLNEDDFNRTQVCVVSINSNEYEYNVDFFNLMSYWNTSATRLVPEQKQRIYDIIADDDFGVGGFGGDMSHLTDSIVPPVNFTPPNYAYLRQFGYIDLAQYLQGSSLELVPFLQGKVRTRYSGPRAPLLHDRPYIGDGVFKMNRFIPLNEPNSSVRFRFDSLSHQCEDLAIYTGGYLDVLDVIAIRSYILGQVPFTNPYQMIAADVNNTGHITVADIGIIVRRVLLGDTLAVPDYRFVPKYALTDHFTFDSSFNADPFSAVWTYSGTNYSYKSTATTESYLGEPEVAGGLPNLQSFPLSLTDTNALKPEAVSFNAIRSGDVYMEQDLLSDSICGTPAEDQFLDSKIILKKNAPLKD